MCPLHETAENEVLSVHMFRNYSTHFDATDQNCSKILVFIRTDSMQALIYVTSI